MRRLVADASVAIKWVISEADSQDAAAPQAFALVAPDLIRAECGNILWKQVQLGRASPEEAQLFFGTLALVPVVFTASVDLEADALRIACELGHPIYDCYYLALAERENVPLVTADRRLVQTSIRYDRFRSLVLGLDEAARIRP